MNKTTATRNGKRIGYIIYIAVAVVLIFFAVFIFRGLNQEGSTKHTVATVNDEAIVADELKILMERNRGQVFDYFRQKYGADVNVQGFWSNTYGKEIPGEHLKHIALQKWVRIKVQQTLAVQEGLIDDNSYEAFLKELKEENDERKRKLENNEVIMGMKNYDEYNYLQTLLSNIQTELKSKLGEKELKPTDTEINRLYEEIKDTQFRKTDVVSFQKIFVENPDPMQTGSNARAKIKMAEKELKDGKSFKEVSEKFNKEAKVIEDVLNEESLTVYRKVYGDLLDIIPNMKVGEISNIIDDLGGYYIIKCTAKEELGYYELADVKEMVVKSVVDAKYEQFIDNLVAKADVDIIEDNYRLLKADDSF